MWTHWEIEEKIILVRERCTESGETTVISFKKGRCRLYRDCYNIRLRLDTSDILNAVPSLTLHTQTHTHTHTHTLQHHLCFSL